MKTLNYILIFVILILICYILFFKYSRKSCREIIDKLSTSTLIDSSKSVTDNVDFIINLAEKANSFQEYIESLPLVETKVITKEAANIYHDNYFAANTSTSATEAILFNYPLIFAAMKNSFGNDLSHWSEPNFWNENGFFIYLANYGSTGDDTGENKNQTTVIFQLAKRVSVDPNTNNEIWKVFEKEMYNFGGLKPPKIEVNNPVIIR